nr:hypothetical protein [Ruminococcus sp.]
VVYLVPTLISDFFIGSYYLESEKFAPFVPLLNIFTVNSIHEICFFDKMKITDDADNVIYIARALPENIEFITAFAAGIGILALVRALSAFKRKDME